MLINADSAGQHRLSILEEANHECVEDSQGLLENLQTSDNRAVSCIGEYCTTERQQKVSQPLHISPQLACYALIYRLDLRLWAVAKAEPP